MQGWFTGGGGGAGEGQPAASGFSSLLADWNSYAAAAASEEEGSAGSFGLFDIESAVRSANDTVSGTFNVVSKGVREIPGSLQSATSSIPSGKALVYFGLFLAAGVFFIFIAFSLFLPVIVLVPQKFAISFLFFKGPKRYNYMFRPERPSQPASELLRSSSLIQSSQEQKLGKKPL